MTFPTGNLPALPQAEPVAREEPALQHFYITPDKNGPCCFIQKLCTEHLLYFVPSASLAPGAIAEKKQVTSLELSYLAQVPHPKTQKMYIQFGGKSSSAKQENSIYCATRVLSKLTNLRR